MQIIKPSVEVITPIDPLAIMRRIEAAGRTCWKSEERITETSAVPFIRSVMNKNHLSVIEHESISVRVVCDRGVSHEIVRHRLMSYSQESTRYVSYKKKGMEFIVPCWFTHFKEGEYTQRDVSWRRELDAPKNEIMWIDAMMDAEQYYNSMIDTGWTPQQARSVLPNSLKTEIVITGNLRNWRHFFELRTSSAAHPQMREVAEMIRNKFIKSGLGVFFDTQIDT